MTDPQAERLSARTVLTPKLLERFWRKVRVGDDCWMWTGTVSGRGYGLIEWDGIATPAHRVTGLYT